MDLVVVGIGTVTLFSQNWHRVAPLKPKLRPHTEIHRHHYRGQRWHVLQDHATGAHHRLMPSANYVVALMDGERTVQEIWEAALEYLGDDAPTQDDLIQLLAQLHAADVLVSDVSPDSEELFERFHRKQTQRFAQRWASPLALKFPLVDPDVFLARTEPWVKPLFSWPAFLVWLAVVSVAVVLAGSHWAELTQDITDRVLTPGNLLLLGLTYPMIKLLHELGHAYATRVWGGEVHEMGIMLLVLMPIPYCDASSASAFRRRRRRVVVGSAGILVETFLAGLAMFVWLNVEPGLLRATAYNVMIIAGVSTLLVNGNPLLRFDGYYILGDLLEIPNLAMRSKAFFQYLLERYVFDLETAESPATAPGEATWFVLFGIAGFIYRLFLFSAIILFIAGKFFTIGILLAIWACFGLLVMPLYRGIKYMVDDPRLEETRARSTAIVGGLVAAGVLLLVAVPVPSSTTAEGVVWVSEKSIVRAGADGFVKDVLVAPGQEVHTGDPLVTLTSPELETRVRILELRVQEYQARVAALQFDDKVGADIAREELASVAAELDKTQEEQHDLTLRAGTDGRVVLVRPEDLPGRYLKKGKHVGYVLDLSSVTARVVVTQARVDLVRRWTRGVSARLAENFSVIPAHVIREVPAASNELPSNVLGTVGGGQIAIDPRLGEGSHALQSLFQFDVELQPDEPMATVGSRVHVRFDHGYEPIAWQFYRALRQLLLRRFRV